MVFDLHTIVFCVLAVFITVFSILTVTSKRIVRSATYLLFVLFGTAGLYFLMGYNFLGSVQIMVYAGGIVVLYVFSILLTSGISDKAAPLKRSKLLAGLAATIIGAVIVLFITLKHQFIESVSTKTTAITMNDIGDQLLSAGRNGYLLPFEAISVFLLACIIGGVLIARKR